MKAIPQFGRPIIGLFLVFAALFGLLLLKVPPNRLVGGERKATKEVASDSSGVGNDQDSLDDLRARSVSIRKAIAREKEALCEKDPIAKTAYEILEIHGIDGTGDPKIFADMSKVRHWCEHEKLPPEESEMRLAMISAYRRYKVIESYDALIGDDDYGGLVKASLAGRSEFDLGMMSSESLEALEGRLKAKWLDDPLVQIAYSALPPENLDLLSDSVRGDFYLSAERDAASAIERVPREMLDAMDRWVVRDVLATSANVYLRVAKPVSMISKEQTLNQIAKLVRRKNQILNGKNP